MDGRTFTCARCGCAAPERQLKEVYGPGDRGERQKLRVCPECLDDLMVAADDVDGIPGEEKRAAAMVRSEAKTVETTGARPASKTSSAVEQRPEQSAIAPDEGTIAAEPARDATSLPEQERDSEDSPLRSKVGQAPGLDHEARREQGDREADRARG